jgi:dTDP-4-dehydrorhamnose reductase
MTYVLTPGVEAERATLVLGGSGFLGAHVVGAALRANSGPIVSASREPLPPGVEGVVVRKVDALHPSAVDELLDELRPARIVLCTALSSIADCAKYPGLARALNVEFPRGVAERARAIGARLVHVSTDLVFGAEPPPRGGFVEASTPGPLSVYGETKLASERAVLEAWPRALVVRLPLLYGPSHGRGRGASDSLLAAIARGERPMLFVDEFRTPLDVRDAAAALVELAHGDPRGLLHVAGPVRLSRYELGLDVLRAAGRTPDEARALVTSGRRADAGLASERPADVALSSAAARRELRTPLRAGVRTG